MRFFGIDPLAEKYAYQSPYNFSENSVTAHRELEGLEKQRVFYTPFGRIIVSPNGKPTGQGAYTELKGRLIHTYNFYAEIANDNINRINNLITVGTTLTERLLNSEGDGKAEGKGEETKTGTKGGNRAGKVFTQKGKKQIIEENKAKNNGKTVCEDCGTETKPTTKRKKGEKVDKDETQVDHIYPKSEGGDGSPPNGQVLCQGCNNTKSNQLPEDYYKPKP